MCGSLYACCLPRSAVCMRILQFVCKFACSLCCACVSHAVSRAIISHVLYLHGKQDMCCCCCSGNMTSCLRSSAVPQQEAKPSSLTPNTLSPLPPSSDRCTTNTGQPIGACRSTMVSDSSTLSAWGFFLAPSFGGSGMCHCADHCIAFLIAASCIEVIMALCHLMVNTSPLSCKLMLLLCMAVLILFLT